MRPASSDLFGIYLRDIGRTPLISYEEERELGRRVRAGDESAVQELVAANLRFVVSVAKQRVKPGVDLEDLVAEGTLGLYEAARRFDERHGCRFISYAVWWIRRNINRILEQESHVLRYPRGRRPGMPEILRAEDRLARRLERPPRREEVARELKTTPEKVEKTITSLRSWAVVTDVERPDSDEGDRLERLLPTQEASPQEHAESNQRHADLQDAIAALEKRERKIIDLYFGLSADGPCTLEEIGHKIDLSKERVRQLRNRALARLRTPRLREHLQQSA